MEQLTLDIFEMDRPQLIECGEIEIKKGDMVRVVASSLDAEAYNYYEYYRPASLRSAGMVVDVLEKSFVVIYKNGEEIEIEKTNVTKEKCF